MCGLPSVEQQEMCNVNIELLTIIDRMRMVMSDWVDVFGWLLAEESGRECQVDKTTGGNVRVFP